MKKKHAQENAKRLPIVITKHAWFASDHIERERFPGFLIQSKYPPAARSRLWIE